MQLFNKQAVGFTQTDDTTHIPSAISSSLSGKENQNKRGIDDKMKRLLLYMMLFILLAIPAYGAEPPLEEQLSYDLTDQMDAIGAQDLLGNMPSTSRDIMAELGIEEISISSLMQLTPQDFMRVVWAMAMEQIRKPLVVLSSIIGVVILCTLLQSMKTAFWDSTLSPVFNAVAILTIASAIAAPIIDCITKTANSIQDCALFMMSFIPIYSGVIVAGGQAASAATYNMFMFSACQLIGQVITNFVVPLLGIYLAFCLIGGLMPDMNITSVASSIKTVVTWTLGLMLSLFVGLMSIQSIVANGADTATTKAAKFVIGSFVPVIGGALSDAFIAAQGCIKLLKTTLGGFGIVSALVIFMPALLQTVLWYLSVNVAVMVGDLLDAKQISSILKASSNVLGILMAIMLCFALLVIISTTIMMLLGLGI